MKLQSVVFILLVFFTCCIEEDISEKIEIGMYANVGADSFATENASFTYTFGNVLRIEGITSDSLRIILELDSADQPGIYDLGNTVEYEAIYQDSLKNDFSSRFTGTGMVEITELTQTTVEGSFEFTGRSLTFGNRAVSNGVFSVARDN